MRILVTGAAGYTGSALVRGLTGSDAKLVATDQSPPQGFCGVAFLVGNLAHPRFARSLITPGIEAVFHLASLVSGGAEQAFELGTKVNLDATRDRLSYGARKRVGEILIDDYKRCISLGKVVQCFLHALKLSEQAIGARRGPGAPRRQHRGNRP